MYGAILIKHAQACDHMSRGFTRQHAAARRCALIHRYPPSRGLACITGNRIIFGYITFCWRSVPIVTNIRKSQDSPQFWHPTYLVLILSLPSSLHSILEILSCFAVSASQTLEFLDLKLSTFGRFEISRVS